MKFLKYSLFAAQILIVLLCSACKAKDIEQVDSLQFDYGIESVAWHPSGDFIAVGYFLRNEVAIWNIKAKKKVFSFRSELRPGLYTWQEILFSPDGRYLIAKDKLDTKEGNPPFPVKMDSEEELKARADDQRYVLARIWDWREQREVGQIKGAGSQLYGDDPAGMCWVGGRQNQLAVLRKFMLTVYDFPSGEKLYELNLANPFPEQKEVRRRLKNIDCHPGRPEIAIETAVLSDYAGMFGYAGNPGATPIIIADLAQRKVKKILISPRAMSSIAYSGDGKILVSSNLAPVLGWNVDQDYATSVQVNEPFRHNGYLTAIPGTSSFIGLGDERLWLWNFDSSLSAVPVSREKLEVLRISVNGAKKLIAVAVRAEIRLYSYAEYFKKNSQ